MASHWYCPNCLQDIPANSSRCSHCGLDFSDNGGYFVYLGIMTRVADYLERGMADSEVPCPVCKGTGKAFCPTCGNKYYFGGTSVVRDQRGRWSKCTTCDGWGYDSSKPCHTCNGKGGIPARVARRTRQHIQKNVS